MGHPIRFIVPVALREVMDVLLPTYPGDATFERTIVLNPEVPAHAAGNRWDIAITNPHHAEEMAGLCTHHPFATTPLALARLGAGEPTADIAALLREADTIAFTQRGTSGQTFRHLLAALALEDLAPRLRPMPGGHPMRALLKGEVTLAALPLTNIAPVEGVHAAAICPRELDVHIELSLCMAPDTPPHAQAFAEWLTSEDRDEDLEKLGAQRMPACVP